MCASFHMQNSNLKIVQLADEVKLEGVLVLTKTCSWRKVAACRVGSGDTSVHSFRFLALLFSLPPFCFLPYLYFSPCSHFFLSPFVFFPFAFLFGIRLLPPAHSLLTSVFWQYFGCRRVIHCHCAELLRSHLNKKQLWNVCCVGFLRTGKRPKEA